MEHTKLIKQIGNKRLIEVLDIYYDMNDLKGETYCPKVNTDISPEILKKEEEYFENRVRDEGVYGYIVEEWNPSINAGWTHLESIFGFVGQDFFGSGYDRDFLSLLEKDN